MKYANLSNRSQPLLPMSPLHVRPMRRRVGYQRALYLGCVLTVPVQELLFGKGEGFLLSARQAIFRFTDGCQVTQIAWDSENLTEYRAFRHYSIDSLLLGQMAVSNIFLEEAILWWAQGLGTCYVVVNYPGRTLTDVEVQPVLPE